MKMTMIMTMTMAMTINLLSKHLHNGRYVRKPRATAKALKHKSISSILSTFTLLHKSNLKSEVNIK